MIGSGFDGGITDLQVGPDGYLYILTFAGALYRIVPASSS
jgi:glucose/arabinose dehydrogenase